jgi:hypothetical protein
MARQEVQYYEGNGLVYPTRPTKPFIGDNSSPTSIRKYADDLEEYTRAKVAYDAELKRYRMELDARSAELGADLADEYGISRAKADILFNKAWEDGRSEGIQEVIRIFDELYDVADKFSTTP